MPSHYLNQCWNIVNWALGNKLQWHFIKIYAFPFKKMHLNMLSGKWQPFCLDLNVLSGIHRSSSRHVYTYICVIWGMLLTNPPRWWNIQILTHLPTDKMAAISQTIFSDAFLWIKRFWFWLKFQWSLSVRVQLTIGLDNGLVPHRRQAIIWTNANPFHWSIYVAPGGMS